MQALCVQSPRTGEQILERAFARPQGARVQSPQRRHAAGLEADAEDIYVAVQREVGSAGDMTD